jgi:hypothetical protein
LRPVTGGVAEQYVSLEEYYIVEIVYTSDEFPEVMEETYLTTDDDQESAFHVLLDIFEEEAEGGPLEGCFRRRSKEENLSANPQGPKRIEVTLQEIGRLNVMKRLVVTDVLPPGGHWADYSMSGRSWEVHNKKLRKATETYWSSCFYLTRIDAYLGGGSGSCTSHFSASKATLAWKELGRMFSKFQPAEVKVVKEWAVEGKSSDTGGEIDDDIGAYSFGYNEWQGHQNRHWTNKSPSAYGTNYGPMKAYYRVAGDEVGAKLLLEQKKTWEEENPGKTPEQALKEILEVKEEKKAEAEADNTPAKETGVGIRVMAFGGRCSQCQGLSCLPGRCLQEYDLAAYGGTSSDGEPTVH